MMAYVHGLSSKMYTQKSTSPQQLVERSSTNCRQCSHAHKTYLPHMSAMRPSTRNDFRMHFLVGAQSKDEKNYTL